MKNVHDVTPNEPLVDALFRGGSERFLNWCD